MILRKKQFIAILGILVHSLRNREQALNVPKDPSMVLKGVVDMHPQIVLNFVQIRRKGSKIFLPIPYGSGLMYRNFL